MKNQSKIQGLSTKLYFVFFTFLIILPSANVIFWLFYNSLPQELTTISIRLSGDIAIPETLDLTQRLLLLLISSIPLAVKLFAILTIMRLLKLYRKGSIFSAAHVASFKRLGYSIIFYSIAGILNDTGMGVVLTMNNPPGERVLSLGLGSNDLTLFVIAVVVLMLSRIMEEGRKQAEDQALTI